jgi:Rhodopirellula transposase DDE domain
MTEISDENRLIRILKLHIAVAECKISSTSVLGHDMGQADKAIPCGIVNEDSGALFLGFGDSCKTSDFMVDNLNAWWGSLTPQQQTETETIQIKVDNGPESSGVRTQFLNRAVDWADQIGKTIHLLYFPPYHSKYNP